MNCTSLPCPPTCSTHGPITPVENDPWNLQRFVEAQGDDETYDALCQELSTVKERHFIWYVLPQWQGFGFSPNSVRYAIRSLEEGEAYVSHPVLGFRYFQATSELRGNKHKNLLDVMSEIDVLKTQSSLTLFSFLGGIASLQCPELLKKYFKGRADAETVARIAESVRQPFEAKSWTPDAFGQLALQSTFKGKKSLNLACFITPEGDFHLDGHDHGESDYEWNVIVKKAYVPQLASLLGASSTDHLLDVIARDWVPREGKGLERLIRLSGIKFKFTNYGMMEF